MQLRSRRRPREYGDAVKSMPNEWDHEPTRRMRRPLPDTTDPTWSLGMDAAEIVIEYVTHEDEEWLAP